MKNAPPKVVLAIGFFVGNFLSAAPADQGSLSIPEHRSSNILLELQATPAVINPSEFLKVFVGNIEKCCEGISPMAGRYLSSGAGITFDPAFDLIEGQNYTVMSRGRHATGYSEPTLTEFIIQPAVPTAAPEVIAMYPSADDIPENTLRFYIHFSTPMQPHLSTEFIKLVDAKGTTDTAAFMAFKQELWSEDRKRLTLLMDPGRIKRGVSQNLNLGPALQENNRYSIVVEDGWPSANGMSQAPRFEKVFSVSQALRTIPSTDSWQITPPRSLTLDPLVIKFDRPFDNQLSQNSIKVLSTNSQIIPGTVSVENHEKTWRFEPLHEWTNAKVVISVDSRFEDVAGNNFRDLLDHSVDSSIKTTDQHTFTVELKPTPD